MLASCALNLAFDPAATGLDRPRILSAPVDRERARIEAECRAHPPERARAPLPAVNIPALEFPLVPLAIAATRAVLQAGGPDAAEEARQQNNLSNRLAEAGERAVAIYAPLAADNFAAYGPDLAKSLGNLATRQQEGGPGAEATQNLARAIEILQRFAPPGTVYADWLAACLRRRADWQGD